jgi:hypothetical protein
MYFYPLQLWVIFIGAKFGRCCSFKNALQCIFSFDAIDYIWRLPDVQNSAIRCDTDMVRSFTVCLVNFWLCFMFNCMGLGCDSHEQLSKRLLSGVLLALWTDCKIIFRSNAVYEIAASEFGKHVYAVLLHLFRMQVLCGFLRFEKIGSLDTYNI